jgi:hypothetical protein
MPKKIIDDATRTADLLEKLVVFQMYALRAPQDRIAKTVGRKKAWVNQILKGLPKGGLPNAGQAESTKAKKRSSRG